MRPPPCIDRYENELGSWLRAFGEPDGRVRPLLARGYVGFTQTATAVSRWIEPPRGTATIILNLGEHLALERGHYDQAICAATSGSLRG